MTWIQRGFNVIVPAGKGFWKPGCANWINLSQLLGKVMTLIKHGRAVKWGEPSLSNKRQVTCITTQNISSLLLSFGKFPVDIFVVIGPGSIQ